MNLSPSWNNSEFRLTKTRLPAAERASTCLKAPLDSNSYQDFVSSVIKESSTTHLKYEEVNPADCGYGQLMTQPIGRREEQDELEFSPERNSIGQTAW